MYTFDDVRRAINARAYEPSVPYAPPQKAPVQNQRYFDERVGGEARFKADAISAAGMTGHAQADYVFDLAWERGHSEGLGEVLTELEALVDLLIAVGALPSDGPEPDMDTLRARAFAPADK